VARSIPVGEKGTSLILAGYAAKISYVPFSAPLFRTDADMLQEGYCTLDEYHWICPECFRDFREMFGWQVVEDNIQKSPIT